MAPADITGRKVLNRYKIIEKIGGGGMSVVWKAYDLVLDRNVALKVLRPEMSEDEEFIRRFRREARAVASLSHPNIVNIYDVGEDSGLYFIVMELIEGETLRDKMKREGPMGPREALEIASQICDALSCAHARRIIHRDVKPQNILLTANGHVKVADFGIARALGAISTTSQDLVVGSAPYVSPEQAKNGVVSTRSDIYSLGVVLFEMLAGRQPFEGETPVAVALQHVHSEAPTLKSVRPAIPESVSNLVAKALRKDPEERFASVDEMRREMETVLAGLTDTPGKESRRYETSPVYDEEDDAVARPKTKKSRLSFATKMFIGVAAVALAMAGYALIMFYRWMDVPIIEVPEVVNRPQIEAQDILRNAGLILRIAGERPDPEVPAGVVISQSPAPGEKVKQGREVWCLISKGQDLATIPDVTGMTLKEASIELENDGVSLGNVTRIYHEEIEKDRVVSQNPKAGLDVPKGTTVDLTVSNGPQAKTTKVPNVIGMPLEKGKQALAQALLNYGDVNYEPSEQPEGTIIGQNPSPGTEVPFQFRVSLTVSGRTASRPNEYTKRFFVPKEVAGGQNLVHVTITVRDSQGERVVYDRLVPPEMEMKVDFTWTGSQATVITDMGGKKTYETIRP